jgi:hypothetical protein
VWDSAGKVGGAQPAGYPGNGRGRNAPRSPRNSPLAWASIRWREVGPPCPAHWGSRPKPRPTPSREARSRPTLPLAVAG